MVFPGDDGVNDLLDHFSILVRSCRQLQPDGFELTLELRRTPVGKMPTPTTSPTDQVTQATQAQERGGNPRAS